MVYEMFQDGSDGRMALMSRVQAMVGFRFTSKAQSEIAEKVRAAWCTAFQCVCCGVGRMWPRCCQLPRTRLVEWVGECVFELAC